MALVKWRLGLGVGPSRVALAIMLKRRVVWLGVEPIADVSDITSAVSTLIGNAPRPRLGMPTIAVAMGPALAQIRPLVGIPVGADDDAIDGILSNAHDLYFLKRASRSLAGGCRYSSGQVWGTSIDQDVAESVQRALHGRRCRLVGFAASATVLAKYVPAASFTWSDGTHRICVQHTNGELDSVRPAPQSLEDLDISVPLDGHDGVMSTSAADAIAAAAWGHRIRLVKPPRLTTTSDFQKFVAAGIAVAVAGIVTAPFLTTTAAPAETRMSSEERARIAAVRQTESDIDTLTAVLNEAADFANTRVSIAVFLNTLGSILPRHAMVTQLRIQGDGVTLTLQAASMSETLTTLLAHPWISTAAVQGAVRHEVIDGVPIQTANLSLTLGQ